MPRPVTATCARATGPATVNTLRKRVAGGVLAADPLPLSGSVLPSTSRSALHPPEVVAPLALTAHPRATFVPFACTSHSASENANIPLIWLRNFVTTRRT